MEPFTRVAGPAVALPAANIDTDVIMPKQFLKRIDRRGLADGLFHDLRFDDLGRERPDFALNRPETRQARFLIVGPNFGCGSSREYAVWGLTQFGIRALLGTSYAGIFFDNCARNGLLALSLPEERVARLIAAAQGTPGLEMSVDLERQEIAIPGETVGFDIDPDQKSTLIQGLDAIGRTLSWSDEIAAFESGHLARNPWLA